MPNKAHCAFHLTIFQELLEPRHVVTVCGVGGRTLSVGFHIFRFGWMNLRCGEGDS